MSSTSKAVALVNDRILGAFANAPTSETLDHAVRYLSTWSGSDKLFMVIQYALKIIIPFLNLRARLQQRAGLRKEAVSPAAESLGRFYSIIGNSRMLWRFWGVLPIYQWLTSLERMHPITRKLLTIERLQGWAMVSYYPLENLYYLRANGLIPATLTIPFLPLRKSISLDAKKLSRWSVRFWAAYVFLQLVHLREDFRLLKKREKALSKAKGPAGSEEANKAELSKRWYALLNEVVVNIGYFPLTIHWSLEQGLFKDDIWVGVFGLIAGLAALRSGWKATALPKGAAIASSAEAEEGAPAPTSEGNEKEQSYL